MKLKNAKKELQMLVSADTKVPGEIFTYATLYPMDQSSTQDPQYAYKASTDPDTMYMHQAMREPNAAKFKEAMQKEMDDQLAKGNFTLVKHTRVPKGRIILPDKI